MLSYVHFPDEVLLRGRWLLFLPVNLATRTRKLSCLIAGYGGIGGSSRLARIDYYNCCECACVPAHIVNESIASDFCCGKDLLHGLQTLGALPPSNNNDDEIRKLRKQLKQQEVL